MVESLRTKSQKREELFCTHTLSYTLEILHKKATSSIYRLPLLWKSDLNGVRNHVSEEDIFKIYDPITVKSMPIYQEKWRNSQIRRGEINIKNTGVNVESGEAREISVVL